MRNTFAKELLSIMDREKEQGKKLSYLITGDLGYSAFESIKENHADRYVNAGVSEQNMVGISAGLANYGKQVFVYSIIPFVMYRAFEQVRNDVCYPNLKVRIVGVGAGLAYADAGATHHPFEDLRVADSIPNLTILSPADPKEVGVFMQHIGEIKGPVYMRLSRNNDPTVHDKHGSMRIGKALKLVDGDAVLIVCTGILTRVALELAEMMNRKKSNTAEVLEVHTFKPFDNDAVRASANGKKLVITIEDNTGAFSEKVAAAIAGHGSFHFVAFKLPDDFTHVSGTRDYLFEHYGITASSMHDKIKGLY